MNKKKNRKGKSSIPEKNDRKNSRCRNGRSIPPGREHKHFPGPYPS